MHVVVAFGYTVSTYVDMHSVQVLPVDPVQYRHGGVHSVHYLFVGF